MGTTDAYQKHDPLRACDICGVAFHKSELKRIGPLRWACPDDKDGLTAEQIARHNASVRPLTVKPVRNPRVPSQVPTYQQAEGVVFNLILMNGPSAAPTDLHTPPVYGAIFGDENGMGGAQQNALDGLDGARQIGWMGLYLGNLALENRRPRTWIEAATRKLVVVADTILARQFGPTWPNLGALGATTNTEYGAVYMADIAVTPVFLDVIATGVCLMALLRAFQVTGLTKYRDGARRAATFLRRAQCCGFFTADFAKTSQGGRFQPGPFPSTVRIDFPSNGAIGTFRFSPLGIVCAWALRMLEDVDGDATYGDATAVGDFAQATSSTLSACVAACVAWWANGAQDGNGAVVVGFGSATPRDSYAVTTAGSSTWSTTGGQLGGLSTVVQGFEYAAGLRGLWECVGYNAQVSALNVWLRGFTSEPINRVPATWNNDRKARSTLGTYDATLCLAEYLGVTDAAGSPIATDAPEGQFGDLPPGYDWRTAGLLAPIQSSTDQGSLRRAKDEISKERRRRFTLQLFAGSPSISGNIPGSKYEPCDIQDDLRLLTFSGLSFQTSVGMRRPGWSGLAFGHYVDLQGAAIAADVYRYPPNAFPAGQG